MWKSSPCNTIGDGDVNFDVGNDAHVAVNNLSWQGYWQWHYTKMHLSSL
jgi:hypothetical protein